MSRLSIVLHTHMPYVEGFGTWPFGEEWLWEAIATSYLPLLDVLDAHPGRVTLSLTPVLCDQLEAPGALERCLAFLREIRPESHRLDIEAADDRRWRPCWSAARRRTRRPRTRSPRAATSWRRSRRTWRGRRRPRTPVLPLLATDTGVRLQLRAGIAAHRERFGEWDGGLWLPECAHAPWLDDLLEEASVRVACVDWTDVLGPGAHAPRRTEAGVVLAPIDREAIELVWHARGYPSQAAYLRHAPADRAPAPGVGGRRRRRTTPARRPSRCARDAEDFVDARGGARRRVGAWRSTPSCSATSGTRAWTGCAR